MVGSLLFRAHPYDSGPARETESEASTQPSTRGASSGRRFHGVAEEGNLDATRIDGLEVTVTVGCVSELPPDQGTGVPYTSVPAIHVCHLDVDAAKDRRLAWPRLNLDQALAVR